MFIKRIIIYCFFIQIIAGKPPFFITSPPKAGTHLLTNLLEKITNSKYIMPRRFSLLETDLLLSHKGEFLVYHLAPSEQNLEILYKHNLKGVMIIRDPRDLIVSTAFYIQKGKFEHWPISRLISAFLLDYKFFLRVLPSNDRFYFDSLTEMYQEFMKWSLHPELVYITRFEDLVGSKGGGTDHKQKVEIKNIVDHLGIKIPNKKLHSIAKNFFGSSKTFRSGQIGAWKEYFTPTQRKMFAKFYGNLLFDLGYEINDDWVNA